MEKVKYLIIGNSAGGIGAAEAIREVDRTGAVDIISDEPYPACPDVDRTWIPVGGVPIVGRLGKPLQPEPVTAGRELVR